MSHYSSMEEEHDEEMQVLSNPCSSPSLDLQLSISVKPPSKCCLVREYNSASVEALKWEAAEQIRLAAMEKAYAEHVMELTRREMEMAQSEFLRARTLWERAREEVDRADKINERTNSTTLTCFSCSHKFNRFS